MAKEIKVLLINPSPMTEREMVSFLDKSSILRTPNFEMPIGLLSIAGYLQARIENISIKLLDMAKDLFLISLNYEKMLPITVDSFISSEIESVDFKPDIVGVSIMYSTSYLFSLRVIKGIRDKWKDAVIICGGNHATNYQHQLLSIPDVDYVVRGEGEIPLVEFIKGFQNSQKSPDVTGLVGRDKIKTNPDEISLMVENLDELPLSAYSLLDLEAYRKFMGASLLFYRGCPFKCTFCASHTVHGRRLRLSSNERILKELKCVIEDYGFKMIIIQDDLLGVNKKDFIALLKTISEKYPYVKFHFSNGFSVTVLDEEIIDAVIRVSSDFMILAIESGSSYTQRHIVNKNVPLDKAKRLLEYLWEKGITTYVNFILGYPEETKELMYETIDFINSINAGWVLIFTALPLPGTDIYKKFVLRGDIDPNDFNWDATRHGKRGFDTPEISARELEDLAYDTNIKVNFFNNSNLRHRRYEKAIRVFSDMIVDKYPFHTVGRYCRAMAYLGLGDRKKADAEFAECVRWIGINEESRRLFERYRDQMPLLSPFLDESREGAVFNRADD